MKFELTTLTLARAELRCEMQARWAMIQNEMARKPSFGRRTLQEADCTGTLRFVHFRSNSWRGAQGTAREPEARKTVKNFRHCADLGVAVHEAEDQSGTFHE